MRWGQPRRQARSRCARSGAFPLRFPREAGSAGLSLPASGRASASFPRAKACRRGLVISSSSVRLPHADRRLAGGAQSVVAGRRHLVAERRGRQAAIALYRMQTRRHRVHGVVKARGERFARAGAVESVLAAARHRGDQRALHQALAVDDRVVIFGAQRGAEGEQLRPGGGRQQVAAPAPDCNRDHALHGAVQRRDLGEGFLDHPVDDRAGNAARDIAYRRAVVDHIAERGGFDEEDARHGKDAPGGLGGDSPRGRGLEYRFVFT